MQIVITSARNIEMGRDVQQINSPANFTAGGSTVGGAANNRCQPQPTSFAVFVLNRENISN